MCQLISLVIAVSVPRLSSSTLRAAKKVTSLPWHCNQLFPAMSQPPWHRHWFHEFSLWILWHNCLVHIICLKEYLEFTLKLLLLQSAKAKNKILEWEFTLKWLPLVVKIQLKISPWIQPEDKKVKNWNHFWGGVEKK